MIAGKSAPALQLNTAEIMNENSRIFVAGHRGMVGSAILRKLHSANFQNIVIRTHDQLDLTQQERVRDFFMNEKIDVVMLSAAKVGGIHANHTYPADFIYQNLMIQSNVIQQAYRSGVDRILFLGSSCIYPKYANQPMREEELLTGLLEPTNEPYAIAKIAGIKLCESFNLQYGTHYRSIMPTNLYGPNDNFDLENSHVLPAMLRKFHLAKLAQKGDWKAVEKDESHFGTIPANMRDTLLSIARADWGQPPSVSLWGSGKPKREFLHVDDLASACLFLMNLSDEAYDSIRISLPNESEQTNESGDSNLSNMNSYNKSMVSHINAGTGQDIQISELAERVKKVVAFDGTVAWDSSKPDGTPRKLLDMKRLTRLGWQPEIELLDGIKSTYDWYQAQVEAQ